MSNVLEQAINSDDGDHAARIIQDALGIETDDVAKYCVPKTWPAGREQRARIIGEWLQMKARFLASPQTTDELVWRFLRLVLQVERVPCLPP